MCYKQGFLPPSVPRSVVTSLKTTAANRFRRILTGQVHRPKHLDPTDTVGGPLFSTAQCVLGMVPYEHMWINCALHNWQHRFPTFRCALI